MFYVFLGVGDLNARETGVPERHEEEEAAVCVARARCLCVVMTMSFVPPAALSFFFSFVPVNDGDVQVRYGCHTTTAVYITCGDAGFIDLPPLPAFAQSIFAAGRVSCGRGEPEITRLLLWRGRWVRRRPVAGGSQPPRADGARPWEHLFSFAGRKARNEIQKPREERNKRVEKESNKKMTTTTTQTTKKKKKKKKLKRSFKRRST